MAKKPPKQKIKTSRAIFSKEVIDRYIKKFQGSDAFLSNSLLTLANMTSSSRENMVDQMFSQYQCILNGEVPRVYTGYEYEIGTYNDSYYKADRNYKVVDKLIRYKDMPNLKYWLVVQDERGYYDIIPRIIGQRLTESYGYAYNTACIDSKEPGGRNNRIEKGEILYKNTSFDEVMNYRYGRNVNTIELSATSVSEDAAWVSQDFAHAFEYIKMHSVEVTLNTNELLLNLYGDPTQDEDRYQPFPHIGSHIKNRILCAKRQVSKRSTAANCKDFNLINISFSTGDSPYYVAGQVVDIEIFSNNPIEDFPPIREYDQIRFYYEQQQEFYNLVRYKLRNLIERKAGKVTDALRHFYHRAEDLTSGKSIINNGSTFENITIIFTVLDRQYVHSGNKIAGRFGDKNVIGKISPREEMPINEYGVHADLVIACQAWIGRLNTGQLIELELTFIADNIIRELRDNNIPKEIGFPIILAFYNEVNKDQAEKLYEFLRNLSVEQQAVMYNELLIQGLKIHQPPFWGNVTFDELRRIYQKYGYRRYRFTYKGKRIVHPLIMGSRYIMLLKQTPDSKYSCRNVGYVSSTGHPSKALHYQKYRLPHSNTPIRIGDMERIGLCMINDSEAVARFLSAYSSSQANRAELVKCIFNSASPYDIRFTPVERGSINRKMLNVFFKTVGIELVE